MKQTKKLTRAQRDVLINAGCYEDGVRLVRETKDTIEYTTAGGEVRVCEKPTGRKR